MIVDPVTVIKKSIADFAVPLIVTTDEVGAKIEVVGRDNYEFVEYTNSNKQANFILPAPGNWFITATSEDGKMLPTRILKVSDEYTTAFKFAEPLLPAPYQEVAYIENPNLAYAQMPSVMPASNYKTILDFELIDTSKSGCLLGEGYFSSSQECSSSSGYTTFTRNGTAIIFDPNYGIGVAFGLVVSDYSALRNPDVYFTPLSDRQTLTVDYTGDVKTVIYGGIFKEYTPYYTVQGTAASHIFGMNTSYYYKRCNTISSSGYVDRHPINYRLYSLLIYNSAGELVYRFIPCKNIKKNTVGLYDLVTGNYVTGNFEAGPEV